MGNQENGRPLSKNYSSSSSRRMPAKKPKSSVGTIFARVGIVLLTTIVALVLILFIVLKMICSDISPNAKSMFVTTVLESGQLKFLASWFCSKEEIEEIVNANTMEKMDTDIDPGTVIDKNDTENSDPDEVFDANGIRIEEISGRSFFAKMLIIKDPSQVKVGTSYPWGTYGKELGELVSNAGAVAGVNGGLYYSAGNTGGSPKGIVVQNGQITRNKPQEETGYYMIGLNSDDVLIIKDISGMSDAAFAEYVASAKIRDAVTFQEEASDANNHFVPLIINGTPRQLKGQGSGANPRTAIGQRKDGAILLLVTDGRGASGHLGATASDLISIMQQYGAVNAANLDGGSSSSMVYNGKYEMTSVTFYFQNSSWKLPTAFVVAPKAK